MTKQERINELQIRKAKADALGQEAIQKAQELYEQICDELYRLQLPEEDPVQLLERPAGGRGAGIKKACPLGQASLRAVLIDG